jgi:hypothetical protein
MLAGDGGVGKSYASLALAAALTTGNPLPTGESSSPENVVLLSAEDALPEVIVPRLTKLNADLRRVTAWNFEQKPGYTLTNEGVNRLDATVAEKHARLVVVDPIVHFLGDHRDMHRANEVRSVMSNLAALAARHACAVLVLAHVNKAEGSRAAYRLLGSVDFRNAARSMLIAGKLDDQPERGRAMFHDKANGAPEGNPLGYNVEPDTDDPRGPGVFKWSSTDLAKSEVFGGKVQRTSKLQHATDLLRELLADGKSHPSDRLTDIITAGGHISAQTVRRAREQLGVVTEKHPNGTTRWRLTLA